MNISKTVLDKLGRIRYLRRGIRLVWESSPRLALASIVLILIQGVLPLLALYLMKLLIDTVELSAKSPDKEAAFRDVVLYICLAGAVALAGVIFASLAKYVGEAQSIRFTDFMHSMMQKKSNEVDLAYFENSQYYDTFQRARNDAFTRPQQIINGLTSVARSGISLIAIATLLIAFHWGISVLVFAAAIPGILLRIRFANTMYQLQRDQTQGERKAWAYGWMMTEAAYAKEIRLMNLGGLFMQQFREARTFLSGQRLKMVAKRNYADFTVQGLATVAIFASYSFIAYQTVAGAITLGALIMYYRAFERGQSFLNEVLNGMVNLYEDVLYLTNVYEFLDLKATVVSPEQPRPLPATIRQGITFDHVTFDYPMATRKVLKDINVTIRPGEVVAFVGENGAGKTTLIKLLCRLYDPSAGSIRIDGVDIREFDLVEMRRKIGIVFQDYIKYHMTARENIWLGNTDIPLQDERVITAATQAGADEVISSLPQGYDSMLGKWFEKGEELSIGQWQKIAIARAFVRDAEILVLDEPTSALDAKSEVEVFERFRELVKGRTAILISHRFSTVKMADQIYVIEHGEIVEHGNHDELMLLEGRYAEMFNVQAQHYV